MQRTLSKKATAGAAALAAIEAAMKVRAALDAAQGVRVEAKPFPVAEGAFERTKATLQLVYGHSVAGRLRRLGDWVRSFPR